MSEEQVSKAVDQGVILTLSTERRIYLPGEPVVAEVHVTNTSAVPIDYATGHIGDPSIRVTLTKTPMGDEVELQERGREQWAVLPVPQLYTLEPGQSITREVVWNQRLSSRPGAEQVPAGTYNIQARFLINGPFPLTADVTIEIRESPSKQLSQGPGGL